MDPTLHRSGSVEDIQRGWISCSLSFQHILGTGGTVLFFVLVDIRASHLFSFNVHDLGAVCVCFFRWSLFSLVLCQLNLILAYYFYISYLFGIAEAIEMLDFRLTI